MEPREKPGKEENRTGDRRKKDLALLTSLGIRRFFVSCLIFAVFPTKEPTGYGRVSVLLVNQNICIFVSFFLSHLNLVNPAWFK